MAPGASWRCCFRPQVAEGSQGGEQIAVAGKGGQKLQQDKCTEDSANAEIFSRLHCRPIQTSHEIVEDAEEFASPASSYQTCFSEQDPTDFGEFSRYDDLTNKTPITGDIANPFDKRISWWRAMLASARANRAAGINLCPGSLGGKRFPNSFPKA